MDFREALAAELLKEQNKLIESKQRTRKVESVITEDTDEYLEPQYDSRNSFYKKAKVVKKDNGDEELYSYDTLVGGIKNGVPYTKGNFSATTSRHQKEYFKQRGFDPKEVKEESCGKIEERDRSKEGILKSVNDIIIPELEFVAEFGKDAGLYGLAEICEEYANSLKGISLDKVEEAYSERLGGDPEDYIADLKTIKEKLDSIDVTKFGAKHSIDVVEEFIETVESQINMTKGKYDLEEGKKEEFLDVKPDINVDVSDSSIANGNTATLDIPLSI